jgi:hypothetical protein
MAHRPLSCDDGDILEVVNDAWPLDEMLERRTSEPQYQTTLPVQMVADAAVARKCKIHSSTTVLVGSRTCTTCEASSLLRIAVTHK